MKQMTLPFPAGRLTADDLERIAAVCRLEARRLRRAERGRPPIRRPLPSPPPAPEVWPDQSDPRIVACKRQLAEMRNGTVPRASAEI